MGSTWGDTGKNGTHLLQVRPQVGPDQNITRNSFCWRSRGLVLLKINGDGSNNWSVQMRCEATITRSNSPPLPRRIQPPCLTQVWGITATWLLSALRPPAQIFILAAKVSGTFNWTACLSCIRGNP
jgi:hypothetical protein